MLSCRNTTFNPRDVSLSWDPPLHELQNGVITGYQLSCIEEGSAIPVPFTNKTLNSSNTFYTITDITPFQLFNCSISAIDSGGIGPSEVCVFMTAEDG